MSYFTPIKQSHGSKYEFNNTDYLYSQNGGSRSTTYTASPDLITTGINTNLERLLKKPEIPLSPLFTDALKQQEVDGFYLLCQRQREQYKDNTGRLHCLDFFQTSDYFYQCPPNPTSVYIQFPQRYVRYRSPVVYCSTLRHGNRIPPLPYRSLQGHYSKERDNSFNR